MKASASLALLLTLSAPTSQAAVSTVTMDVAIQAYQSGETSRRTLVVKPLDPEAFFRDYGSLGAFTEIGAGTGHAGFLRLHRVPTAAQAERLLQRLTLDTNVEYAYFNPIARNAVMDESALAPAPETASAQTPDLESRQFYLEASPRGVGARQAWTVAGGTGENVKAVDIEVCWQADHEDFQTPFYLGANPACSSNGHGTAVWGEVAAKKDGKGVTGIAHGTKFGIHGFIEGEWDNVNEQYITGFNRAVQGAMTQLSPGDVLIIEQHMVGPDAGQYTAVEYWPHMYEQLKAATDRGIICVAAAGNGNSNFDNPAYGGAFDLSKRDSGCILVGAGDPDTRERLSFSNYGSRIDAFGFGRSVTTTGYGDAFNGGSGARLYTHKFSGTSSATPIVSGAVAVVSSIIKQAGKVIPPKLMRKMLRETGAKQGPKTSQERIGNLPNIPELVTKMRVPVRRVVRR